MKKKYEADLTEAQAIQSTVKSYFDGMVEQSEEKIRRAFRTDVKVAGIIDGKSFSIDLEEYISRVKKRDKNGLCDAILSIDISGDIATAKVRVNYPDMSFTDYLTLLREGEVWMVGAKTSTNA